MLFCHLLIFFLKLKFSNSYNVFQQYHQCQTVMIRKGRAWAGSKLFARVVRIVNHAVYLEDPVTLPLEEICHSLGFVITPDRGQSKMLLTINEQGSKIVRNRVFDCHLSPFRRQMSTENSVSNDFLSTFVDSINVFDYHLIVKSYWTVKLINRSNCKHIT